MIAAIAFGVGVYHNLIESGYIPPEGLLETFRLMRFSEENLEKIDSVHTLPKFSITEDDIENADERLKRFHEKYLDFESNKLLTYKSLDLRLARNENNVVVMLFLSIIMSGLLIFTVPWSGILSSRDEVREKVKGKSITLLIHPLERYNTMMQIIGSIASLIIICSVLDLILPRSWGVIITIIGSIEIIIFLYYCIKLTIKQIEWKNGWKEILDYIMQKSTLEKDHDLHNRALLLKQNVSMYPDIPISQLQKAGVVIFALLQFLVPRIITFFSLKDFTVF
ncbi:hypothetical protein [Larkinella soli]|uniref:hypothetical protein n=1 Tax=Larkinella soli TaxID=1770527 RepID=UPI000FFB60B9|nr:hypothetical protein [Larkinella soli]